MILYGAGGHAKVVISAIRANGCQVEAIFDDDPLVKQVLGIPVTGAYSLFRFPAEALIISIGDNTMRRTISQRAGHAFGRIIHPSALLDLSAEIGEGTCVLHHAVVQAGAVIGRHVIVNTAASVDHDCRIEDFVHLGPGVILAGNVSVGENTLVGIGSIVAPGLSIGKNCLISAGSVVTKHVPDGATVRGNPARVIRPGS